MKRQILFLLFFVLFFQNKVFLQNKNDFFPLSKGSYYLYKYDSYSSSFDMQFYEREGIRDTGWVRYSVESSENQDTMIVWKIRENDSIYTHHYKYTSDVNLDTCFWTIKESYFELMESLTGNHKLTCFSGFGIWDSPINIPWAFRPQLERYKADSNSYKIDFDVLSARTTVILERNVGLTSYRYNSSIGNHSTVSRSENAVLIEQCFPSFNAINKDYSSKPEYFILQNYPNPFNPSTTIRYSLAEPSYVTLKIYDVLGCEAAVLVNGEKPAGIHNVVWNAGSLPSGVYFYELRAGNFTEKRKMLLIR